LSEALGKVSFWFTFRRLQHDPSWSSIRSALEGDAGGASTSTRDIADLHVLNLISTIGSFILAVGRGRDPPTNLVRSLKKGVPAGPDPWKGNNARVVHDLAAAGEQLSTRSRARAGPWNR